MTKAASSTSPRETLMNTSDLRVRKKAKELIDALQGEAANHGGLRTQESLRLENELRLELSRNVG